MRKSEKLKIAEFLHETVKFWSEVNKDFSMRSWSDAEEWQREFMHRIVHTIVEGGTIRDGEAHELYCNLQKDYYGQKYAVVNRDWSMLSHWQKKKYRIIRKLASELKVREYEE